MSTHVIPLRRPWFAPLQRLIAAAADVVQTWRAERRHRRELALMAELEPHMLDDIGADDEMRARAEAHREARIAEQLTLRVRHQGW